jgi:hypothetical protein
LSTELLQWVKSNHLDMLIQFTTTGWNVMNLRMQEDYIAQANDWDEVTADAITAVFAAKDAAGVMRDEVPASSFGHAFDDQRDYCKAFRTRSNTMGVMQWVGLNTAPHGVKIRYRFVEASTRNPSENITALPSPAVPSPDAATSATKLRAIKPIYGEAIVALMERNDPKEARRLLEQVLPLMGELQISLRGTEAYRPVTVGIGQVRLIMDALGGGKIDQAKTLMRSLDVSGPVFEGLIQGSTAPPGQNEASNPPRPVQAAELEFRLVAAEGDPRPPADELANPNVEGGVAGQLRRRPRYARNELALCRRQDHQHRAQARSRPAICRPHHGEHWPPVGNCLAWPCTERAGDSHADYRAVGFGDRQTQR